MQTTTHQAELTQRIRDSVLEREGELVNLVGDLVRFRSENEKLCRDPRDQEAGREQESACQAYIASALSDLGMQVDRWEVLPGRDDVVGTLDGDGNGRSLILNGHVDVVPAGDPTLWDHDPWGGEVIDGSLWGRGSVDMKGGIGCGIMALRILRDLGIHLDGSVLIETVVDEETGGPGTRATVERGYRADGAIALEPSTLDLQIVEGGLEWVRIVVRGVSGHAGWRFKSVHAGGQGVPINAVEKMAKILTAVQELERHWGNTKVHPLLPKGITTIHPGVIIGGSGGGVDGMPNNLIGYANFADYCSLGLDLKYLPNERVEAVKREFEEYIAAVAQTDPWLREHPPEIEWGILGVSFPPSDVPVDHPLVQTLATASEWIRGTSPVIRGMEAVTDVAWLAEVGIPAIIYGPGNPTLAHGPGEHVSVDDLRQATEVLALTLANWCGVEGM